MLNDKVWFCLFKGDHLVIANAGDSRAVIATTSDDGNGLVPVQLSVDFKPNIPGRVLEAFPYFTVTFTQMKWRINNWYVIISG